MRRSTYNFTAHIGAQQFRLTLVLNNDSFHSLSFNFCFPICALFVMKQVESTRPSALNTKSLSNWRTSKSDFSCGLLFCIGSKCQLWIGATMKEWSNQDWQLLFRENLISFGKNRIKNCLKSLTEADVRMKNSFLFDELRQKKKKTRTLMKRTNQKKYEKRESS